MSPLARLDWLRAIAADPDMHGPPLAVAVELTRFINTDSGTARPAVATIAAGLRLTTRTVQKATRRLEAAGLLNVDHPSGRVCCVYRPNPVRADMVGPCPAGQGSAAPTLSSEAANPVQRGRPTLSSRTPEQGIEQVIEQGCDELRASRSPAGDASRGDEADSVGPVFALHNGAGWRLSRSLADTLAAAYPAADLDAELAKAAAWCATEQRRRKTAAGMPRFLRGWLGRSAPRHESVTAMDRPSADALAFAAEVEREISNGG